MAQVGKLKFNEHDLYMHYTTFEDELWMVVDSTAEKTEFYKTYDGFEFLFDLKDEAYLPVKLEVNEEQDFVKRLFDFMLGNNNSYFKEFQDSFIAIKLKK